MTDDPFRVRSGRPGDHPFVYNSTARSVHGSPFYRDVSPETWTMISNAIVRSHLTAPDWRLLIAHPADNDDEIAGYLLHRSPDAVCMLYTKQAYRRLGVARMLMNRAGLDKRLLCVLGSPQAFALAGQEGYSCQLSPYLI